MEIVHRSGRVKVEKTTCQVTTFVNGESKVADVIVFRGHAKIPVPFTFGLINYWKMDDHTYLSQTSATSAAAEMIFKKKFKLTT